MIQRLVAFVLRVPALVLVAAVALVVGGALAYKRLDVEAYPNPCPPLIEVLVQPPGWSAEETERYITVPLEVGLSGIQGLSTTRSNSLFGLSDVKVYFNWGTDYWADRQEVINRLSLMQLPNGNQAYLSPWNATGEIYRYTLEGPGYTAYDKKTVDDWIMERQLKQVPGVIDHTSYGGLVKQYHVEVDPFRLRGHNVSLGQTIQAIQNANQNVGGDRLSMGAQSYDIRGIGLIGANSKPLDDIANTVIAEQKGTPVRVGDVADVTLGHAPRLGQYGRDDDEDIEFGVVLMRYGGETPATLSALKDKLKSIDDNKLLPPGMKVVPYYDRGDLVHLTMHTVSENILIGMALVVLTLLVFLNNARAALITAINIPLALLVAFIGIVVSGTSANLISLGAIDFGIVADSTIIMVENIFRHLGGGGRGTMTDRVLSAAREVSGPMFISTLIIAVAFLPLFTLTGVPGAIFAPMARTYAYAIGGAILLALTLTPTLTRRFVPAHTEEKENVFMRWLHKLYSPFFDAALRRPKTAVVLRTIPIFACIVLFPMLGRDFMPKLEEGNLWIRATMPMSISREQAVQYDTKVRRILRGCPTDPKAACTDATRTHPEVRYVISLAGRPDDGTDPTSFYNNEFYAPLIPLDDFAHGRTKQDLINDLNRELSDAFPGVVFNFSQYISDNVEEAVSGVKGENSVKVFGPDIEENERVAGEIEDAMKSVPGVTDLGVFRVLGQPQVKITPDRAKLARYGLNTGDVNAVVQTAIGSNATVQVYEGEKLFDLTVRFKPEYRSSVEAISEITVSSPDGSYIPLGQIAKIETVMGPSNIYREAAQRYTPIKFSVRGRDLAGAIGEAQAKVGQRVHLAYNQHLDWAGEINELKLVEGRLMIIIPLTMALIALLVYIAVRNWLDTIIILIDIPVACTGGVLALLVTHTHFSVSAAMGFVSVFGIAVQDALLMVTYFQRLHFKEGLTVEQAAREASEKRFRPVLMTTLVATLGLLPAALSHGIGAQTQQPLAIVVIGGSLELAILTRLLQPPMRVIAYRWLERWRGRRGVLGAPVDA